MERYLPRLTSKYRLPPEEVALQWRVLRLVVHDVEESARHLERARNDLAAPEFRGSDIGKPGASAPGLCVVSGLRGILDS